MTEGLRIRIHQCVFLIALLIAFPASTTKAQNRSQLILEYADSSRIELVDGKSRSYFYHPRFRQDNTTITSEVARLDEAGGQVWLDGHVTLNQPGRFLRAQAARYNRDARTAIALGSVVMVDSSESFLLRAERAIMNREEDKILADSMPHLITDFLLDSTMWTHITGDTLIHDRRDRHGTAIGNVEIRRSDWIAYAGRAEIWTDSNVAVLTDSPVGRGEQTLLGGDSLTIWFSEGSIQRAVAVGNARGAYGVSQQWVDSTVDWLTASALRIVSEVEDTASEGTTQQQATRQTIMSRALDSLFGFSLAPPLAQAVTSDSVEIDTATADTLEPALPAVSGIAPFASGSDTDTGRVIEMHRLSGTRAELEFDGGHLRSVKSFGQARVSTLPPFLDKDHGFNQASGDSLHMVFDTTNALAYARIDGAARGEYRTPNVETNRMDTIHYAADAIEVFPEDEQIVLTGDADSRYGEVTLTAGRIVYHPNKRSLTSAWTQEADTATGLSPDRPLLTDAEQQISGDTLTYNIDTRRGRIRDAKSLFEGAYHSGREFKKYTDDVFFVENGGYTSCDRPKPHWRFESSEMKVIRGDKVIARPVVLKLGELPTLRVPYYIFPIKPGRHSGLLPIKFGNFSRGGRFINNVGYYWAASDYFDWENAIDYHEEHGLLFRSSARYALRYVLNGTIRGSYSRESDFTGLARSRTTRWEFHATHDQTLSPTARITGQADFLSDKSFYTDFSPDVSERLNRQLRSFLSFNKRFSGSSLTGAIDNVNNLDTEERTRILPSLQFSMFARPLFSPDSGQDRRWFHNFYLNYSSSAIHRQELSLAADSSETERRYLTVDHRGGVRFQQKLFSYVTLSNSLSLQETWYYVFDTDQARVAGVPIEDESRRLSGSYAASLNGTLYGLLRPKMFGLSAIRHAMTPTVSFSFTPPVKQHDELRQYTRAGGGSSRRAKSLSFGLNNVLEAKFGEGAEAKRLNLFNFSLGASYNLEADTRKWSKLTGNLRTALTQRLDLNADATWDLYDPETLDLRWYRPKLERFGLSAGASFVGGQSALTSVTQSGTAIRTIEQSSGSQGTKRPFNGSFSYRYEESKVGAGSKTHWIGWRMDFSPTDNWSISYNQTYRMDSHRSTSQEIAIYRDLHCWQGRFSWVPLGSRQGYYFLIQIKAIPDIKYERSESGIRGNLF